MRNIFLFIRRYFNFIFFLVLQIIALSFLFRYNKFHEAAYLNVAGEVTGAVNERYNNVQYYFKLKKTNEALAQENVYLRNLLRDNYQAPDTARRLVIDSIRVDSIKRFQKYSYYDARVVGSFISTQMNYLTIHRGEAQGIKKDMGVIGPLGTVGRVVTVSENYAVVMSMLNQNFKVKAKLKKSGENGTVEWDGSSPQYVLLRDIPKSAAIANGDTVLTSELSSIYPPGIMVGTVAGSIKDASSAFYIIKIKTATNFANVQYVTVIDDLQRNERQQLEESIKK